jgi:CxxC-x17-CxxC domain-containing protein
MSNNDVTLFAKTDFRGEGRVFGIKDDDRLRHMYIIGKTGMGKSVLLENLVISDILKGKGMAVVDPHGDLVEKIIKCIPASRINDVIYFNPADLDNPIAFNVLEKVEPKYRHLIASGIVGVFKKLWADSWGPRLEYLLRNAILALLDYPDSTLLGVNRILIDKDYRKKVVAKVKDPVVKTFWLDEFTKYNQSFMVEAIAPIQNKVGQFLSTALIRNIVGQVKSTIDLRKVMDEGKIILMNLSKGRIGEDASSMLGAMLITKIQLAAMSRVDLPERERRNFYLYVDEFQNFSTESFANILSEARKYHLNLIVAHQYVLQLDEKVADAVFGNVGTFVVFRVGASDAEVLAKEFAPLYVEEDFVNLPKYHVYLRLMIDGVASEPFSAATLPPIAKETGNEDTVVKVSRERYGKPRDMVEDKINRWSGVETEDMIEKLEQKQLEEKQKVVTEKQIDFLASFQGLNKQEETTPVVAPAAEKTATASVAEEKSAPKAAEELFIVKCNSCGAKTKINFKPDGVRPIFCKECLKEYRSQQSKSVNVKRDQTTLAQKSRFMSPVKPSSTPRPAGAPAAKPLSLKDALSRKPTQFGGRKSSPPKNLDDDIASAYQELTSGGEEDIPEQI